MQTIVYLYVDSSHGFRSFNLRQTYHSQVVRVQINSCDCAIADLLNYNA